MTVYKAQATYHTMGDLWKNSDVDWNLFMVKGIPVSVGRLSWKDVGHQKQR
jgi:hypothetical protein